VVVPLIALRGARSGICRSRCAAPRFCLPWWFRGFVSGGGRPGIWCPAVPALLAPYSRLPWFRGGHRGPCARAVLTLTTLVLRDKTTKPATPETAQPLAPRTADVGTVTAHEVRGRTT